MQIKVNTKKPYNVQVLQDFSFQPNKDFNSLLILTDDVVAKLYLEKVYSLYEGKNIVVKIIKHGEESKSTQNYLEVLSLLLNSGFTRNDAILALGGGVVGDLAGFVASTYMRGIKYFQMPTTLLSQIDSSVGGKTAVNLDGVKNAVGTFYQPTEVYINTSFLKTLQKKEFENGYGELAKYAFLTGKKFTKDVTTQTIAEAIKYKISVVEADEYDRGRRTLLNLGHTVGHAIEALSDFDIPHGVCVYKGISAIIDISAKLYDFEKQKTERLKNYLSAFGIDDDLVFDKKSILQKIKSDKKTINDGINLVTVYDMGDCRIENISFSRLGELL